MECQHYEVDVLAT